MIDDELRMFCESAERFFTRAVPPERAAKWRSDHRVERDFWREVGEAGFLGLPFPEEYGGFGLDYRYEVAMMDLVSRMDLNFPYSGQDPVICRYVLAHATEEQKRRWLPRMAKGDLVAAVAMSEPGAGSDLQSIRTSARRDGNEYVINGTKMFISNGQIADWVLVVCKTDPEAGARGISLIAVETEHVEGFRRGRTLDKIGLDAQDTSELFFDDVRIPIDNLLGGVEGQGFAQLMQELPRERMAIAIDAVATMERAIAHTVDYVAQRKVFGETLGNFQNTQFKLAECKTLAAAAKALTYDGVAKIMDGSLDNATSAMIKLFTSETAGKIVDECLQLHGGYGYINDYPIARMYRDSRIFRIFGGSSEVMKMIIARTL
jgi:alkylation response protein AidB-like acyl-CoA dehydrogenase